MYSLTEESEFAFSNAVKSSIVSISEMGWLILMTDVKVNNKKVNLRKAISTFIVFEVHTVLTQYFDVWQLCSANRGCLVCFPV